MDNSRRDASRVLASALAVIAAAAVVTAAPDLNRAVATATTSSPSHAPGDVVGIGVTFAQAQTLQQAVDAGHQPWRLDPVVVARAFAVDDLGWSRREVRQGDPHTVEVTNSGTGEIVSLQLGQPVREGSTGIWVVTRVDRIGTSAIPATPVPGAPNFTG
ncbi:MAG TPA: hypothetical protein VLR26_02315 [Frankiaceae bacterium]|nr:hypothetical protein [Frankiaceae bacterium]